MTQSNSIKESKTPGQDTVQEETLNIWDFLTTNSIENSKCPVQGSLKFLTNRKTLIFIGITGIIFIFRNHLIQLL